MNKMKIIVMCLAIASLSACQTAVDTAEIDQLKAKNAELESTIRDREQAVGDFVASLESVQSEIRDITYREGLLEGVTVSDAELARSPQQEIMGDIALVEGLIKSNQQKIDALTAQVKKGKGDLSAFEQVVANLKLDLLDKENEMIAFKGKLASMEEDYATLFDDYNEQLLISNMQDGALHKAYFAYGSKDELKTNGVIEKDGGVLGVGVAWKLKADFNKDYFTEVDSRQLSRIPLGAAKVEFITQHPTESYELIEEGKQIKELVITDADSFWGVSHYLAIMVE